MGNLYDGMSANILKEAPASALYLGIYESARLILDKQDFFQDFPIASYLVAGGEFHSVSARLDEDKNTSHY
tara:strand:- start:218 stop:430 length:213 start_codon:yes stop_codon:yes gene_type:complete